MSARLTGDFLTGTVHLSHFDYKTFKVLRVGSLTQHSLHRKATTECITKQIYTIKISVKKQNRYNQNFPYEDRRGSFDLSIN